MKFHLQPGKLTWPDLELLSKKGSSLVLDSEAVTKIQASYEFVQDAIENGQTIYGVNTGFGALASKRISHEECALLQKRIVLSHAAGVGKYLPDSIVRLILVLKINSLARGYSGVRLLLIERLMDWYNQGIYPCIPEQGSVGASGDLAPLAHVAAVLLGEGHVRQYGSILSASELLARNHEAPFEFFAKEGLALLNGTQVSTAIAIDALIRLERHWQTALITGALSVDAARGSHAPFDARIHAVRGHESQTETAGILRELLIDSEIVTTHQNCEKVQDPYCLRCQPQVMGACLSLLRDARRVLIQECNAVTDNPLIFAEDQTVLSGGNFHAEPVAFAADQLALAIAEIGSLAERRIALLVDSHFSGLPAFLVEEPGLNSGFMVAQVTAAALACENKALSHAVSVDSLPTSANQEDHVSMATYAALRLHKMNENLEVILAIELLAACQGLDLLAPHKTSPRLEAIKEKLRELVPYYKEDRYFAKDIEAARELVRSGIF